MASLAIGFFGDGRRRDEIVARSRRPVIAALIALVAVSLGACAESVDATRGDGFVLALELPGAAPEADRRIADVAAFGSDRRARSSAPSHATRRDEGVATVIVNGLPLMAGDVKRLEQRYSAPLPDGRYWYDRRSGLWGVEGGPATGQIHPWLDLGGPLAADASAGDTRVFINGREIHVLELALLRELFGEVPPGRYWLDSNGIGGLEGLPASFDIGVAARGRGARAGDGYIDRGPFGAMGGDGDCFYFSSPDVPSYVSPGC